MKPLSPEAQRRMRRLFLFASVVASGSYVAGIWIRHGMNAGMDALYGAYWLGLATWSVMKQRVRAAEDTTVAVMVTATKIVAAEKMKQVHPLAKKDPRLEQARLN